jgi:hypothetical protein
MVAVFAGAGFYLGMLLKLGPEVAHICLGPVQLLTDTSFLTAGRTPTKATDEAHVEIAKSGMPWESEGGQGKYSYHPGGDTRNAPKDAPSAINVVVVPDVNLPKVPIPLLLRCSISLLVLCA